jgi:hypothetical protein
LGLKPFSLLPPFRLTSGLLICSFMEYHGFSRDGFEARSHLTFDLKAGTLDFWRLGSCSVAIWAFCCPWTESMGWGWGRPWSNHCFLSLSVLSFLRDRTERVSDLSRVTPS